MYDVRRPRYIQVLVYYINYWISRLC